MDSNSFHLYFRRILNQAALLMPLGPIPQQLRQIPVHHLTNMIKLICSTLISRDNLQILLVLLPQIIQPCIITLMMTTLLTTFINHLHPMALSVPSILNHIITNRSSQIFSSICLTRTQISTLTLALLRVQLRPSTLLIIKAMVMPIPIFHPQTM